MYQSSIIYALCIFLCIDIVVRANTLSRRTDTNCNGSTSLCNLPFDHVTFAGTHNSAAYHLKPECPQTLTSCGGSEQSVCQNTERQCLDGWEEKCTQSTQSCKSNLPEILSFLSVFCTVWEDTCTLAENVCKGWQLVCTKTVKACSTGINWMCEATPDWLKDCAWQNQANHDIAQQLNDVCHGMGELRALGAGLVEVLGQVKTHLETVPDTVLAIEFGDVDGDKLKIAPLLRDTIKEQLSGYLIEHPDSNSTWPTLGQLIAKKQRVAIFASDWINTLTDTERPAWLLSRQRHTADEVVAALHEHVNAANNSNQKMECLDMELSPNIDGFRNKITQLTDVCLPDLAMSMNKHIISIAQEYIAVKKRVHRIRIDNYWTVLPQLLEAVSLLNDMNLTSNENY
ncbi:hypothetical protein BDF19DRAFT_412321 [Syncephalis fuscata]|nr:hypothetical protein BDF19DRAFT_412321 [Syncephalis fuscata]